MKAVLLGLTFLVLITSNISKWFLDVGIRVGYHVPPLAIWLLALLLYLGARQLLLPPALRRLVILKVAFVCAILVTAPIVMLAQNPDALTQYLKGLVNEIVNAVAVAAMLLYVAQLGQPERRRLLDLYLVAVSMLALYSIAQAVGATFFGVDLDREVTRHLPLWSATPPSVTEDRVGFFGRIIYRLSGVTGDPNLNGVMLALALPVIFLRSRERSHLALGTLAVVMLMIIASTLSTTVVVTVLAATGIMLSRALAQPRLRRLGVLVGTASIALAAYVWQENSEIIRLIFSLKTGATVVTHARIAADALRVWVDHPFGIGVNGFAIVSPDFSTHNSYLTSLVELGPFGLLVVLATAATWLRIGWRSRNDLSQAALVCSATLALSAIGHDVFNRIEFQLVVSMLIAMAATGGLDPTLRAKQAVQ